MPSNTNRHHDSLFKRVLTCNKWGKIRRFEQEQKDRDDGIESVVQPILDAYYHEIRSEPLGIERLLKLQRSLASESADADKYVRKLKLHRSNRKIPKTLRFSFENDLLNAEVESRVLAGKVLLVSQGIGQQKAAAFSLLRTRARTGEESVQVQQAQDAILEQRRRSSISSARSGASFKTATSAASQQSRRARRSVADVSNAKRE